MQYTKTVWVNGTTPAINQTNLNNIESGIYNAAISLGRLVVNVKDAPYSAVGDGVTNDTAAIVAAEAAAAVAGGIVFYPKGTYLNTNFARSSATTHLGDTTGSYWKVGSTTIGIPNWSQETTGAFTLYVATTGSDSANNGLSSTYPFATIQKAIDMIPINVKNFVTVQIADGTYTTQGTTATGANISTYGSATYSCCAYVTNKNVHESAGIFLLGNTTTPANVVVDGATTADIGIFVMDVRRVNINGIKIKRAVSYNVHYKRYASGQIKNCVMDTGAYGLFVYEYSFVEIQGVTTISNATTYGMLVSGFSLCSHTGLTMTSNTKGILVNLTSNLQLSNAVAICSLNNTGDNLTIDDSSYCYADTVTFAGGRVATIAGGKAKFNAPTFSGNLTGNAGVIEINRQGFAEVLSPAFDSGVAPASATTIGISVIEQSMLYINGGSIQRMFHNIYADSGARIYVKSIDLKNALYDGINANYSEVHANTVAGSTINARTGIRMLDCKFFDEGSNTVSGTADGAYLATNQGRKVGVPASASAAGLAGDYAADGSYFYICRTANTWMRVAIATW